MSSRERPILFSAPMVRAILAGTKTQTRRVVKPTTGKPIEFLGGGPVGSSDWNNPECWGYECHDDAAFVLLKPDPTDNNSHQYPCPYGQAGDRLWVRETWAVPHSYDHLGPSNIPVGGVATHYAATEERGGLLWRPSIHMCRWASRITLEITGVRVERLKEISDADAQAEGIERRGPGWAWYDDSKTYTEQPVTSFRSLWESINGDASWHANPWVWVVEFKKAGGA